MNRIDEIKKRSQEVYEKWGASVEDYWPGIYSDVEWLLDAISSEREQCARIAGSPACVNATWSHLTPMEFGLRMAEDIALQIRNRRNDELEDEVKDYRSTERQ